MTTPSRPETQYDAFLFASLRETDAATLSVLSLLARQDVDPWQEAARLTELPKAQAINSLAARIWKSDSTRWSPTEASMLAVRLVELLPPRDLRPGQRRADDSSRLGYWMVASILFMSIAMSGNNMQKMAKDSANPTHSISLPEDGISPSSDVLAAIDTCRDALLVRSGQRLSSQKRHDQNIHIQRA